MTSSGPASLVVASLMAAAVPVSPAAAAQRTPASPVAPLDERQARDTERTAAQRPDRDDAGRPRTGLRGWIRERFEAPAKTSPESGGGFAATAGTVVSGSGLAAGARYRTIDVLPRGIDAEVGAMFSLRGYQEYSGAIGWLGRDRSTLSLDAADTAVAALFNASAPKARGQAVYADIRHRIYPRHRYFGVGMESRIQDEGDYTLSGTSIDGVFQRQVAPGFGFSVRGGWMLLETGAGRDDGFLDVQDRFSAIALPGLDRQSAFVTAGLGAVWDLRDNSRAPEAGWFAGTSLRQFVAVSQDGPSFARATLDVRGYRRLPGGTLALRGLTSADLKGSNTPFYLQASLGGPQTLRGFSNYRFADRALAHGSIEYRWRALRYVEIAPFLDAGTVGRAWTRLSAGAVEISPGIGIRGRTDSRVLGRLDWSRSREGHRVTLGVGPAF